MVDTVSPQHLGFLDQVTRITRCPLPRGIKESSKKTINAWIDVARGAATDSELQKLKKPRPLESDLVKKCASLIDTYGVVPPADYSQPTLRSWLGVLGSHVPVPPQDRLLAYWKSALAYLDLNDLAKEKTKHVAEKLDPWRLAETLPAPVADFEPSRRLKEGQAAALLLAYALPVGKEEPSALLAILLSFDAVKRSFGPVSDGTAPFFNREWLEPPDPDHEKADYFGDVEECDAFVRDSPPPNGTSWPEYWQYVVRFVEAITETPSTLPDVAPLVGKRDTGWKIVAWQAQGLGVSIGKVYERALDGEEAPLLRLLSGPARPAEPFGHLQALGKAQKLLGHMDVYQSTTQQRSGFALEKSQRIAATAASVIADGDLLAVNGPPGTGKTSFLRAVIGTIWVEAALKGEDPPIILATAATNQAVTNIIKSFSDVPGPALEPVWESRWLPNLPSYGWFYPASTRKDSDYPEFMILRWLKRDERSTAPHNMTAAAAGFASNAETQRSWLADQYLDLHRQCLQLSRPAPNPAEAARLIQDGLAKSILVMHDLQQRFRTWVAARETDDALSKHPNYWRSLRQQEQEALGGLRRHHTALGSRLKSLTDALRLVQDAERIDRHRVGWWYRIKRLLFGDDLAASAAERRSRAEPLLAADPDYPWVVNTPSGAINRRIVGIRSEMKECETAITAREKQAKHYSSCVVAYETWAQDGARIAAALGTQGSLLQQAIDAWAGEENAADQDPLVQAFESALDIAFRFRHFHMAARYWEARWLEDVPVRDDLHDEKKSLQRAAMLAPVFVSTVYTVPRIHNEFGFADLLIFDESGQASPEVGVGSFAFAKRAVVVGDAWQLKPIWKMGREADRRLARDHEIEAVPTSHAASSGSVIKMAQTVTCFTTETKSTLGPGIGLIAHYRCRADIIEFSRRLIYANDLIPCRHEKPPFLYPPMAWVAVETRRGPERRHGSWVNMDQVEEILRWLRHDGPRLLDHYHASTLSAVVALIAPFRAQANALRRAIENEFGADEAARMVINTVHALQGAEKPIVAFTLTQEQEPFFVNRERPNLLNVAVSRAQDCFVLFADPKTIGNTGKSRRAKTRPEPLWVLIDYLAECGRRLYPREYVVIEAPGKERAVQEALGLAAKVISTGGHFRDIRQGGEDITFDVTNDVTVQRLREAAADLNQYDAVYLATDDDEDGEEIAWHVMQVFAQEGVTDQRKLRRMRFYALTEREIRRSREDALPGIDARRVRTSLLRKFVDRQLHAELRRAGVHCSRPQLALLREAARRQAIPSRWRIQVTGKSNDKPVTGYVVSTLSATTPATEFADYDAAQQLIDDLHRDTVLAPQTHLVTLSTWPTYPPNTTARMLISAYRRLGWLPRRTMAAMRALYEGRRKGRAIGDGPDEGPST